MSFNDENTLALQKVSLPSFSLLGCIRSGYYSFPDKQMVIESDGSLTYADAYFRTTSLAWFLRSKQGIDETKTVLLSALNVADYPVIVAAVQACGARLVLATGSAEAQEIVGCARQVSPDLALVSKPDLCEALRAEYPSMPIFTVDSAHPDFESMEEIVRTWRSEGYLRNVAGAVDSGVVLFSSGSTGTPKAILNRSSSFARSGTAVSGGFALTENDVCYLPVPFSHTYGVVGMYAALLHRATLVTLKKYRPESSLSMIVSSQASIYFGVPTMFLRELRINDEGEWDVSCLRAGMIAGASCPEAVLGEYEERFGCVLTQSYGVTETAATLTMTPMDATRRQRATSVGLPIDGVSFKIEEGTGEICTKSPSLMNGILHPDGSLDCPVDEDGWFHTGDVGAIDDDGFLYITGRIKDMIIRGGINIFPAEVENAYQEHEGIAESCLVGYPDPELGERSCLCVIMKREDDPVSTSDLRLYAKGNVEKCKIPDTVIKLTDFPRLANGKVNKKELRAYVSGLFCPDGQARKGSVSK